MDLPLTLAHVEIVTRVLPLQLDLHDRPLQESCCACTQELDGEPAVLDALAPQLRADQMAHGVERALQSPQLMPQLVADRHHAVREQHDGLDHSVSRKTVESALCARATAHPKPARARPRERDAHAAHECIDGDRVDRHRIAHHGVHAGEERRAGAHGVARKIAVDESRCAREGGSVGGALQLRVGGAEVGQLKIGDQQPRAHRQHEREQDEDRAATTRHAATSFERR